MVVEHLVVRELQLRPQVRHVVHACAERCRDGVEIRVLVLRIPCQRGPVHVPHGVVVARLFNVQLRVQTDELDQARAPTVPPRVRGPRLRFTCCSFEFN